MCNLCSVHNGKNDSNVRWVDQNFSISRIGTLILESSDDRRGKDRQMDEHVLSRVIRELHNSSSSSDDEGDTC
uniref:Uncharacterized protein n=1 Tax=Magallana gigas TaxID=29159 RepID=K1PQ34_MAGGI